MNQAINYTNNESTLTSLTTETNKAPHHTLSICSRLGVTHFSSGWSKKSLNILNSLLATKMVFPKSIKSNSGSEVRPCGPPALSTPSGQPLRVNRAANISCAGPDAGLTNRGLGYKALLTEGAQIKLVLCAVKNGALKILDLRLVSIWKHPQKGYPFQAHPNLFCLPYKPARGLIWSSMVLIKSRHAIQVPRK